MADIRQEIRFRLIRCLRFVLRRLKRLPGKRSLRYVEEDPVPDYAAVDMGPWPRYASQPDLVAGSGKDRRLDLVGHHIPGRNLDRLANSATDFEGHNFHQRVRRRDNFFGLDADQFLDSPRHKRISHIAVHIHYALVNCARKVGCRRRKSTLCFFQRGLRPYTGRHIPEGGQKRILPMPQNSH